MATTLFLQRTVGGLKPTDAFGADALAAMPLGEIVKAEVTRPRNLRHHRKMYALLQAIFPHQTTYPTLKQFEGAVKCAVGFGEMVTLPDGRVMLMPGSWAFSKLDQTAFEQVYERVLDLILTRILPGIDRGDLEREVEDILRGRDARPEPPLPVSANHSTQPNHRELKRG
jgi:hypothetical protein